MRRLGKTTSSVVIFFFEMKLALGSHLKLKGKWLPIEPCGFGMGKGTKGDRQ